MRFLTVCIWKDYFAFPCSKLLMSSNIYSVCVHKNAKVDSIFLSSSLATSFTCNSSIHLALLDVTAYINSWCKHQDCWHRNYTWDQAGLGYLIFMILLSSPTQTMGYKWKIMAKIMHLRYAYTFFLRMYAYTYTWRCLTFYWSENVCSAINL